MTAHAHTSARARKGANDKRAGGKRAGGKKTRWIVLGVLVATGLVTLQWVPLDAWVRAAGDWFESLGAAGPVAFVAVYAVAGLALVPASALTVAGGGIFGLGWGLVLATLAANVTAAVAFVIARHVARGPIERRLRKSERFRALDEAIGDGTWKVVVLLRLSPIVPFGPANYAMGLTRVDFWSYFLASLVGMLPWTFLYVYLGWIGVESLRERERSAGEWALLALGLVASAALAWWLTRAARAKLHGRTGKRKR